MQIYVNKAGQQFGPYTMEELQQYLQQGHFTAQDFVFYDGCQEWVAIAQVPGSHTGRYLAPLLGVPRSAGEKV